jgi:hypothetical protein
MPTEFVPRFAATIDAQGKVHLHNRLAFDTWTAGLAKQKVEIVVQKWQKRRSLEQNKAWWGLALKTLSDWNGDEPEEWHKRLKRQFGVKSTAKLTVAEFEELREQTIRWAAITHGVVIPDPEGVAL